MSESFFFIQNHRFLLPDLEHMDSQEIHISSVPRPYNAIFHTSGHSTFSWIEPLLASAAHPLLFIDRRLRNSVLSSLSFSGIPCMEFDAIEEHKSIESVLKLCDFLLTGNANRGSMLFVIGGGITQDVAATASALYKRGLPWTLIPTTLLSQADSCIGSKTCLNYGHAKNLLGLFCAPRQVHIDPAFTRTLPRDDILSGLGEILRLCVTGGEPSLRLFERLSAGALSGSEAALTQLTHASLSVKTRIIEEDEYELDLRRAMNYAHTIGHAVEALSNYAIPHGVGIALGMLVENAIALQKGMLSKTAFQRIAVLAHALVPETAWKIFSGLGAEALLPLLRNDKKVVGSTLKLALLQDIGHIVFADLPLDERGTKTVRNAIHEVLEMRS